MVLHKALAMDNLINSSSNILPRASSHLRHQLNRRRSNSIEKSQMNYMNGLCVVIKLK